MRAGLIAQRKPVRPTQNRATSFQFAYRSGPVQPSMVGLTHQSGASARIALAAAAAAQQLS